jgi:hypothetical protein
VLQANGADIIDPNSSQITCHGTPVPLQPTPLGVCFDLNHLHSGFVQAYDSGKMDGACDTHPKYCTHYANKDMYSYVLLSFA